MNIEINIDRQPVAARSMAVKQISYKEMWEKVSARVDVLTRELEAAQKQNKRLRERNEALWDSYQDLRSTLNQTEKAQNAQNGQGCDKNALNEQSSTDSHKSTPCDFCGVVCHSVALTDSRIAELLATIDQVAIDYGSLAYGLPTHVPAIKARLFEAVRNWLAKGGE